MGSTCAIIEHFNGLRSLECLFINEYPRKTDIVWTTRDCVTIFNSRCPHLSFMVFKGRYLNDVNSASTYDNELENRKNKKMGKVK